MSQNWQTYPEITALLDPTTDDVMVRDVSNTSANATGTNGRLLLNAVLGLSGSTPGGRLTTESGVPVSMSDRTAQGTIYYTPHAHDFVRLWDGTRPKLYQFTERSLSLTLTSGKNYDVFIYDNSGTLTLELSAAWTNDTTRADALAWQAGVGYVKSGTATRLWLGTIRASATNQTGICFGGQDVEPFCFLSNAYNPINAAFLWSDSANSWTYNSSTARQANANSKAKLSVVAASQGRVMRAVVQSHVGNTGNGGPTLGYDSTSAPYWQISQVNNTAGNSPCCEIGVNVGIGYHYLAVLDWAGSGTMTFYGDAGSAFKYSGTHWTWSY